MMETKNKTLKPSRSNYELLVESWVARGLINRDALRMSPSKLSSLVMSSVRGQKATIASVGQMNTMEELGSRERLKQPLERGELDVARQKLEKGQAEFDQESNKILNNIDFRWKKLDEEFAKIGVESRLWLRDSLNLVLKHMKEIGETQAEVDEIRKCGDEVWTMFGNRVEVR